MHDDRSTGADRASATKASSRQPRADAARRTYLLSAALTAFAALGLVRLDLDAFPSVGWAMPVWAVAALAVAGALMVFDVEFRSETYTFTFAELVLVLGLFFATPASLIVGRLGGELLFLTIRERQPLRKLSMNLSAFFAETVVLFTVQQALMPEMDAREPRSWLVALVAVVAAELVGFSAVATAVRWHGGPLTFRSILQIGLVTAPANTSLALVICVLLDAEPLAVPLLGGVAVFLLVTYRSYSALRQRYESLSLLYDFTHLVSGAREPDEVLDAMLNQAKDLLRAERAEFWLQRGDDVYQRHVVDDEGHSSSRLSIPAGLAQLVADGLADRHDAVLLARGEPTRPSSALGDLGARDALVAPILEGDLLIGFVVVANRLSDIYTFVNQDARIFGTLASHAGVALQNGRLIQRLHEQARQREHEALHDPLTGLPNRAQFADRLERRFDDLGHREIAIALMDLDGFKEINDTLGHQSGDRVLVEVAARLQEVVDDDTLAVRLGGDEFALLAPPRATRAGLEATCGAIRRAIGAPIDIDGIHVTMGVSIGLALAPHDGATAETLIRCADVAMYAAKSGSGSGVCFYDADYDENTPRRLTLAHELRTALEARQLHAVFQPKIALATGRVTGVEALCRWEHPTLGTVMPDEFIPLADRIGASGELTALMLSTSIEQVERWEAAGQRLDVAVNVSMQALVDPGLVETVRRLLADSTIEPRRLTLEITETNVMSDAERTLGVLGELAAVGVRLSIDDFGTGYSS
ncbi:MAG: EAL domain-containing protein, partial [Ilumatobacter sp.]|uniref:putative bifunctional diguanylate cyclase/phosphodiesterase n=1 Tax=Ilumatobacter sp. TaxID=1967498 RepID=UPI0026292B2E